MASDPHWNKVVLALHCDGTNGSTTFTDVTGKTVTANGNAQISTAQSKFGGASAYFDGAGDYLALGDTATFKSMHSGGDMTLEFWVYLGGTGTSRFIIDSGGAATATVGVLVGVTAGNALDVAIARGTSGTYAARVTTANNAMPAGAWKHVAVVVAGGTLFVFIDGVLVGSASILAPSSANQANALNIGRYATGNSDFLAGYIDDLRISIGVARYTANFTPPAAPFPNQLPVISGVVKDSSGNFAQRLVRALDRKTCALLNSGLSNASTGAYSLPVATADEVIVMAHDTADADPYWSSVVLAMHMNGSNNSTYFKDEIGKTVTANGNAQISTAQSKFGGASAYFDGTGDYLTVASSADFAFGTGDFTIEFWVRNALSKSQNILDMRPSSTNGAYVYLGLSSAGVINYYVSSGDRIVSAAGAVVADTWTHVALCRLSGVTKLYVGGVSAGSYTDATNFGNQQVIVGYNAFSVAAEAHLGYIDDLRITKGVARYTANFTPPTAAFPNSLTGGTDNAVILDRVIPI